MTDGSAVREIREARRRAEKEAREEGKSEAEVKAAGKEAERVASAPFRAMIKAGKILGGIFD